MMRTCHKIAGPERGFTLVEIMVALVIAMLLMAGVIQIFLSNRETYRMQNGMANIQENARMAMDVLRHDLSMAGNPRGDLSIPAPFDSAHTSDGGADASDTMALMFRTDTDCLGTTLTANTLRTHVYSVATASGVSSLYCATDADFDHPKPIVDGVEAMRVQYGVDTDGDGLPNSYVKAGSVTNWNGVVSVRVALLINTLDPVTRAEAATTQNYYLLGAPKRSFTDAKRRNVYTFTVTLRNTNGTTFF